MLLIRKIIINIWLNLLNCFPNQKKPKNSQIANGSFIHIISILIYLFDYSLALFLESYSFSKGHTLKRIINVTHTSQLFIIRSLCTFSDFALPLFDKNLEVALEVWSHLVYRGGYIRHLQMLLYYRPALTLRLLVIMIYS